jgi:Na+(H+)/acetate symporter ActP
MNISKWINEILSNEKLLRDIRTGVMLTVALSLALIYWGFLSNFTWTGVEIRKVLGLTVVFAASLFIVRIEFKARAFAAEMEENEELKAIEKQLFDEDVDIKNDELGIEYVSKFNKEGQDKANRIKTENTILKLMEKRREYIRKGKPSHALDKEIERLKREPEIDTKIQTDTIH